VWGRLGLRPTETIDSRLGSHRLLQNTRGRYPAAALPQARMIRGRSRNARNAQNFSSRRLFPPRTRPGGPGGPAAPLSFTLRMNE
jgi:hypothetical protein